MSRTRARTFVQVILIFREILIANCFLISRNLYLFFSFFFFRLINKLGDPVRAVASKAIHLIGQLLEAHSAMTPIVLEEIEHLLYRPNVNAKAQYYGM